MDVKREKIVVLIKITSESKMAVALHNNTEEELSTSTDGVNPHKHDIAMHRPGRLERLFAILSCRSRCSIGNSVHFHADHVEDVSVLFYLSLQ